MKTKSEENSHSAAGVDHSEFSEEDSVIAQAVLDTARIQNDILKRLDTLEVSDWMLDA